MQINQLPTIPQAPADADVMAIEVNGVTYKVNKQALASAILGQIGASDNVVDVDHGGTGATTAPAALTNIGALAAANVYNGLDKTASGFALDARQGKVLNDTLSGKLNTANVYNGLDKTASGFALDARQGKALNDAMTIVGNGAFNLGSVAANSSKDLKSTQSAHAMLILTGPNVNLFGLYLIRLTTSGTPNTVTITQGSSITFTPASGKITIGNTSTSSIVVNVIPMSGDSSQFSLT